MIKHSGQTRFTNKNTGIMHKKKIDIELENESFFFTLANKISKEQIGSNDHSMQLLNFTRFLRYIIGSVSNRSSLENIRLTFARNNATVSGDVYTKLISFSFSTFLGLFCGINYPRATYLTETSISPFNPSFTLSIAEIKQRACFSTESRIVQ